jgi:ubiquinone/menaquinone biosynthesis C-methylase UbiE
MRDNLRVRNTAEDYDRYTANFVDLYDQAMIDGIREQYRESMGDGVLIDVGTGTAQLLVKMAGVAELSPLRIIGTEYFDDMVEGARQTVKQNGLDDRIAIDKADVHGMPYPSDYALFIISRSTVHHWADPVKAFREIYRILKPGGVAIIHDMRRDPNENALRQFNEARERAGVGPTTLEEKYTAAEIMAFIDEAGLGKSCEIIAPNSGPGSIGMEIRITK